MPIGSVKGIDITDDGQAVIEFSVDDDYAPLPDGTHATIRQSSQSGIANRYIDLTFPPRVASRERPARSTTAATSAPTTRRPRSTSTSSSTRSTRRRARRSRGSSRAGAPVRGQGKEANAGFQYLNPALSHLEPPLQRADPRHARPRALPRRLVAARHRARREARRPLLPRLAAQHDDDGARRARRPRSPTRSASCPPFMRQANTTFVNLRAALDDVDPLVDASKPVVRRARPVPRELRAARRRRASRRCATCAITIDRDGKDNDLIDLLELVPRRSPTSPSSPASARRRRAARRSTWARRAARSPNRPRRSRTRRPIIAFGRPYTPDLFGWFDDFSTTGAGFDAARRDAHADHIVFSRATRSGRARPAARPLPALPGRAEPRRPRRVERASARRSRRRSTASEEDRASD